MALVIEIPCPNCERVLKVPESVFGKKIKCKHCGEPIQVDDLDDLEAEEERKAKKKKAAKPSKPGAAKPKPEAPKSEAPKAAAKPYKFEDDDESANANPMGVIAEADVPRCPHCAKELDPPDAKVCLHCGFNNLTRTKPEVKKVWAPDANDYLNHLGPGVGALAICIGLIVLDIIILLNMRDWMTGTFLETDQADPMDPSRKSMLVRPGAFITLIWAATIMPILGTARFAIKRLAIDNKPLEKAKK